jgi:hypothetical protein
MIITSIMIGATAIATGADALGTGLLVGMALLSALGGGALGYQWRFWEGQQVISDAKPMVTKCEIQAQSIQKNFSEQTLYLSNLDAGFFAKINQLQQSSDKMAESVAIQAQNIELQTIIEKLLALQEKHALNPK